MQRPWGAGNHGALEEVKDTVAGSDGTKAGMGVASGGVSEDTDTCSVKSLAFSFRAMGSLESVLGKKEGTRTVSGTDASSLVPAGPMQSYTWSLTYTVTTAAGSPAENSQQLPCMRNSHVPSSSVTHRIPVYHHREEHG